MQTFYLICAGGGGALVVCQFLASLLGFSSGESAETDHEVHVEDHGADHDHDHASNWFLGLLTFRSIAAAVMFFGLGGLTAEYYRASDLGSFLSALIAGLAALYLVAALMKTLYRLRSDGTARIERALGQLGKVYLTIPGNRAGCGKVVLNVQNRTVECAALTAGAEIQTGAVVQVIGVAGPNLLEVSLPVPVQSKPSASGAGVGAGTA
jgi:hypothetical protein